MDKAALEKSAAVVRGVANVLRGHADLGDYLPPKVGRALSEALAQAADGLAACAAGRPITLGGADRERTMA